MKFFNPFRSSDSQPDSAPVLIGPLDYDDSDSEIKRYATFAMPALDAPGPSGKAGSALDAAAADSPPSYALHQPRATPSAPEEGASISAAELEEVASSAKSALDAERASLIAQPTALAVERLRCFLRYTLAVDYEAKLKDTYLSTADHDHYREIALSIRSFDQCCRAVVPSLQDKHIVGALLWHHVHAPARFIGIPVDLVLQSILRFEVYTTTLGVYKSCVDGLAHSNSVTELAMKFHLDRKILIPAVALNPEQEDILLAEVQRMQTIYFKSVSGMSSIIAAPPDNSIKLITNQQNGPINLQWYELTDLTKKIVSRRERAAAWCPSNRTVQACLKDLQARHQQEWDREKAGKARLTAAPKVNQVIPPEHFDDHARLGIFTIAPNTDFWRSDLSRGSSI